ncbi:DUF4123 domain-containing protein [Chitiniphilus eburneus]|uniref:DUF4123 domain-containing protein n=1 Tax=Chitiniphilus eburneus TaxID=2571148 RepID=A0A4U0PAP8_9NEIS|nr:DUF4123 domain-containing protein [Chitiniphilus eburneus]TJZ64747.1 DUF4123 domain-containing protein [Chitiniphilus eburneus]
MRIDPYSPSSVDELRAEWQAASAAQPDLQLYALLDHAFHRSRKQNLTMLGHWQSLYAGQSGATPEISPLLQCVAQPGDPLPALVAQLLAHTEGQPSLSFIASAQPAESLLQHFTHYVDVTILPERVRYLLRYADTRILPQLLIALDAAQQAELLAPIHTWWYFDREGRLQATNGLNQPDIAQRELTLSEAQFGALLDSSYPDTLANSLRQMRSLAEYLPAQPSALHALSRRLYLEAIGQDLLEHADILGYAASRLEPAAPDAVDAVDAVDVAWETHD